ncbi:MAG TPA: F0F1 ATP synthase subunit epsilon [Deltaproteobacteria bacterium]|nr:F0F1 ATP synthase subunit epsilon [Deltaproteobacteria bacterium]
MADELLLEIVTPEEMIFSNEVEDVYVPGEEGAFGVLIGHAPMLSAVRPGELHFHRGGRELFYAVGEGYAEVTSERVTLLVETCERADRIDADKVKRRKEELEKKLDGLAKDDSEVEKIKAELEMADIKIKVSERS